MKIAPSPLHGESEKVCRHHALREEGRRYRLIITGSLFLFFLGVFVEIRCIWEER
jgi:hypothetical protein